MAASGYDTADLAKARCNWDKSGRIPSPPELDKYEVTVVKGFTESSITPYTTETSISVPVCSSCDFTTQGEESKLVWMAQPTSFGMLRTDVPREDDGSEAEFGHGGIWPDCAEWDAKKRACSSEWALGVAAQAKLLDADFKKSNGYPKDWSLDKAAEDCDRSISFMYCVCRHQGYQIIGRPWRVQSSTDNPCAK
jgi:hypothetical protein